MLKVFFIFEDFLPLTLNIKTTPRRRERRSIKMVQGDLGPNIELWGLNRRFAAIGWRCRPQGLNRWGPDRLEPWPLYEYEYETLHQSQVSFNLRSNFFWPHLHQFKKFSLHIANHLLIIRISILIVKYFPIVILSSKYLQVLYPLFSAGWLRALLWRCWTLLLTSQAFSVSCWYSKV